MRCTSCGNELTEKAKFCIHCGSPVQVPHSAAAVCPVCGSERNPGSKFCIYCGAQFTTAPPARPQPPQPERSVCPGCGAQMIPGQKFCIVCGIPALPLSMPTDGDETVLSTEPGIPERVLILTDLKQPELQYSAPIYDSITIGRAGTDILILNDREVSRLHCRITLSNGQLYLTDEGSRNGTIYCSQKIPVRKQVPLQSGEVLRIGQRTYSVELE